ncbi:MAG: response regulator [Herminiimonas sp.]|nr:response regulator [Herminiimonas sp.]
MNPNHPVSPPEDQSQRFVLEMVGFPEIERNLFNTTFRLTARRAFSYAEAATPDERPDIYLINADNAHAVQLLKSLSPNQHAPAVMIGRELDGIAWPLVERPIRWMRLFDQMDLVMRSALLERARRNLALAPAWDGATLRRARDPRPPAPVVAPGKPVESVLVVDDSATVRAFLSAKLTPFRFNVDFAVDGESAVAMTRSRAYTCVLLDIMMPGIDGYEVCKEIKAVEGGGAPAVVLLSGKSSSLDKLRGNLSGCDAYLTKPVAEDELLATIARFLPGARRAAESVLSAPKLVSRASPE